MFKKAIATFFMIIFMGLIVAPSVIVALDDSIDTSIFYSVTEEENGHSKSIIHPFSITSNEYADLFDIKDLHSFGYQYKNYPKPHLNLISPPPEQGIL